MSWECVSYWIEHHPGLAYWVQAIGSIGAIIGAFSVSAIQLRSNEKQRRLEAQHKTEAFFAVIKNAVENTVAVGDMVDQQPPDFVFRGAWMMHLSDQIRTALDGIRGIPVHELGTYERVVHYGTIVGAISKLQYETDKYMASEPQIDLTLATYESIKLQSKLIQKGWEEFQKHSLPIGVSKRK